jgi:DNA-directed RNA polymerase subunit L
MDIKIVELHKQEFKNLQQSQLILEISGKSATCTLVNSLRRLVIDYIPTYAFTKELITIERNSSVFDNDYMALRLSQITPQKIQNKIEFLEDKYWKEINYSNPERLKHPDDKTLIEFYINTKNNTKDILNVTTNDSKMYVDGEEIKMFDEKYPHLIVKLKPEQTFICRCVGSLGVGKRHNIWSAVSTAYYEEIAENKYKLFIESQGQMDEYDALYKACTIMKEKILYTREYIKDNYDTPQMKNEKKISIKIENEDHTLGNVLTEAIQHNKGILYAGLSKPYFMVDTIIIKLESVEKNPLKYVYESCDDVMSQFDDIQKIIKKIGGKYIK